MTFDKRKALQNALTFTQQGKWDKAIAEYQAILKADSRDLAVCNNLGDLYARAGRAAEAIEQYLKLGELYRADGLSVKAIAVYKKIVKLDSTRTEAHLACADLYEEQGLTGEAKLHLATVAEHYTKAGDSPKVVEIYQRLAQLDPANHTLLVKVGDLLLKEGMREAAAAEYERASQAAQAAGQIAESKRLLQKVRELAPDSAEANLSLAGLHLQEGKYAEAVEILTRVTAREAANAQAWRLLGEAHFGLGQTPEALTALEQAVAL
ncbi:MAG: tetratricopeptide repeat protein, partial [candidate division NC10 bacterium]|nr:tetratricopeptide repeat protein [candidate division NC10 bacterium]